MRYVSVLVLIVASLLVVSPVQALDVCSLVSRSDMAAAIGEAISSEKPSGPMHDPATGAEGWMCIYAFADGLEYGALTVSVMEFTSTSEARNRITLENLKKEYKDHGITIQITEERGIGERAFMQAIGEVLALVGLKGAKLFSVSSFGHKLPPDRLKAAYRKIATMLLPKL